jgi:arsenite methyltransferase
MGRVGVFAAHARTRFQMTRGWPDKGISGQREVDCGRAVIDCRSCPRRWTDGNTLVASILNLVPKSYLAAQLRRPTGLFGRLVIAPALNRGNARLNAAIVDALDLDASDRVLEVGFGGGDLIARMLPFVPRGSVVGADFSGDMVALCSRRFSAAVGSGALRLHCATFDSLPLADASSDKVCTVNTIYFWPDPGAALRELRRVSAPGGRVVIGFAPREALERLPVSEHGFRMYEVDEVASMLRAAGFDDVSTTTVEDAAGSDCCMVAHLRG